MLELTHIHSTEQIRVSLPDLGYKVIKKLCCIRETPTFIGPTWATVSGLVRVVYPIFWEPQDPILQLNRVI